MAETQEPIPNRMGTPLFGGLLALSVSIVLSSWIGAAALGNFRRADDVIVVTGAAKQPITADYIVWKFSVAYQADTLQAAYQGVTKGTTRIRQFIQDQQLSAEVVFSALETYVVPEVINNRETGRPLAYRLTQRVEVRSADVERITRLVQQANALINEGIPLVSEPPEYLYTGLADLRVEMLAAAVKDARLRAEAIAKSSQSQVGPVRRVDTGVFQITRRNSTEVSDYGTYDTSSRDKDITAVVSVTFSLR